MHGSHCDQETLAVGAADCERYRHIRFLSPTDYAAAARSFAPPTGPRTVKSRNAAPVGEESLDPETRRFIELVLSGAGVESDCYRTAPLVRRLQACLRGLRASSIQEAWKRLEREPKRLAAAASALLIGTTQFFRDTEVFSRLDQTVLPKLSARRSGLRVWSVGCADGTELYSVAMLLAERGLLAGAMLLGSDCRTDAITQARRGWFECDRLESMDERLRRSYFVARDRGYQVCNTLREATHWRQGNALADNCRTVGGWDLILCRNLAIYLAPAEAAKLWTALMDSLDGGGVLVVGKAERPEQSLRLARLAPCIYEKTRDIP